MIVVVDYGMGNLGSILNMLKRLGVPAVANSSVAIIEQADKLILPGVGAFDNGMKNLNDLGLLPVLHSKVIKSKTPILGLCLGMQLFTRRSEEGTLPGLGWIDAETVRFKFDQSHSKGLKIPHMGWNTITVEQVCPIFDDIYVEPRFYFVHSYHVICGEPGTVLARTLYGYEFTSAVVKENIVGLQFHPEKSHKYGMKVLRNFAEHF